MVKDLSLLRFDLITAIAGIYDPTIPVNALEAKRVYDEWDIGESESVLVFADYCGIRLSRLVYRITTKDELREYTQDLMDKLVVNSDIIRFQIIVGHVYVMASYDTNYALDITRAVLDDLPMRYNIHRPNMFISEFFKRVPILLG